MMSVGSENASVDFANVDGSDRQSLEIGEDSLIVFPLVIGHGGSPYHKKYCPIAREYGKHWLNIRFFAYITVDEDTVNDAVGETLSQWMTPESALEWKRLAPMLNLWHLVRHETDPALRRAMKKAQNRLRLLFGDVEDVDNMSNTELLHFLESS